MWPGIIKYTRISVGQESQVSLNIQELDLVMWPGIINNTRPRVGHVARYH